MPIKIAGTQSTLNVHHHLPGLGRKRCDVFRLQGPVCVGGLNDGMVVVDWFEELEEL